MNLPLAINGRFLTRPASGVDRFAFELLRAWMSPPRDARVRVMLPRDALASAAGALGLTGDVVGRLSGHAWEQFELSRHCRDELLLNLCSTGPLLNPRQLVVLHDANPMVNPRFFSMAYRSWYRLLYSCLMRRAQLLATVSKFSASELMRHVGGRAANRIEVIYESGEHVLRAASDESILNRLSLRGRNYLLAVGNHSPNKNFAGVVKAAALLESKDVLVVAVGGGNSRVFAPAEVSGPNLVRAGYVTDGQLRALYAHALCFVFPSFYEGFGIPPLEAMHCGCPVVVSNSSALPEICGDAALYCDPSDPADIARQIGRVIGSESLREELRQAGNARTRQFTWARAAGQLEEILSQATSELCYA